MAAVQHSPGGEKIVLAALPISHAENYRYYWRGDWEPGNPPWMENLYPGAEATYRVRYWDPGWQSILYGSPNSYLDRILAAGFDGVYIGTSSNHWYYHDLGRETAIIEMVDLIVDIANYARERRPGFLIIVEDPPEYREDRPDYVAAINGVARPEFYYGEGGPGNPASFGTIGTIEPMLDQWIEAGKVVLIWAVTTDPDQIADHYTRARERGYIPFAGGEFMDYIAINPGFEPD
jgi:cysteinyl-tRNA synthetase, unknown class